MRFAFIIQRYFDGIAGGVESLVASLADKLANRGDEVELLVTCAKDNRSWENFYQPGADLERDASSFKLIRFPVDERDIEAWIPRQIQLSQGIPLEVEDELVWIENSVNSRELYRYISDNQDRFDLFFFGPYLFGTTFFGSQIVPKKSVLIPCLHDEATAYAEIFRLMFKDVRGVMFNCQPEMDLAQSLFGKINGAPVGMGFALNQISHDLLAQDVRAEEYLLYLGRKETLKHVPDLIDLFLSAKDRGLIKKELKLKIAGGGSFSDLGRDAALARGSVVDVPYLSEENKQELIKNAIALCQPSRNESFSIVIMEAWKELVPVLVDARAEVTRYHVEQSNGGLFYASLEEFAAEVELLREDTLLRKQLASAGRAYIEKVYSWEAVLKRFDNLVEMMSHDH